VRFKIKFVSSLSRIFLICQLGEISFVWFGLDDSVEQDRCDSSSS